MVISLSLKKLSPGPNPDRPLSVNLWTSYRLGPGGLGRRSSTVVKEKNSNQAYYNKLQKPKDLR